jgi:DNA primase
LIGQDVDLRRMGKGWRGQCPFHGGKSATSLGVSQEHGLWHCFGCGMGGDAITWMQAYQEIGLVEAVTWLCALAGMPISWREQCQRSRLRSRVVRRAG